MPASYWVFQILITDREVAASSRYLSAGGRCLLDTFRTRSSSEELVARWSGQQEPEWEVRLPDGDLLTHVIVRTVPIATRCYTPDEPVATVERHGFRVRPVWGDPHRGPPLGHSPAWDAVGGLGPAGGALPTDPRP